MKQPETTNQLTLNDRKKGAFWGAAIGDAMGGPVECSHFRRIQKQFPNGVQELVPYDHRSMLASRFAQKGGPFFPGYALHGDAGSVTDDTFCRKDMLKFFLATKPPRTPEMLAQWLIENGELDTQWPAWMVRALHWVKDGKVSAAHCGDTFKQGGGIGWWSPIGMIYAGQPQKAAEVVRTLCAIWKAPLERDFAASVVSGVAAACGGSNFDEIVDAMLVPCGSCARALLERAIRIANQAENTCDLAEKLYQQCLMAETSLALDVCPEDPPTDAQAPLPPIHPCVEYTDEEYTTCYWAEQIPLALAAFVFAKGSIEAIPICVNLGRDCDTTATTVGAWVGGLHGMSGLPQEWVDTVRKANRKEMDLDALAESLCALPA